MLRVSFIVLTTILTAFGQEQPKTVRISGRVVDTTNSAIPNANVKLRAVGSDQPVAEAYTDQNGVFSFPAVPAQSYRLDFYAGGFWSTMRQAANAAAGGNLDVGSVQMGIGTETGTVVPFDPSPLPKFLTAPPRCDDCGPLTESSNIGCVQRLEMPRYVALALSAQIQGTIKASVTLSTTASPQEIKTERQGLPDTVTRGLGLLVPSVEQAIKNSTFRSECAGKAIRLVFRFEIKGSTTDPVKLSFAFGSPNEFWIVSSPSPPMIN